MHSRGAITPVKFIFINRFFHPDQSATSVMLADMISGLDRSSHEWLVITSASAHTPGEDLEERDLSNVVVKRLPGLAKANPGMTGRLLNFLLFYLGVMIVGLRTVKRGDIVVCLTDPPLVSVVAYLVAKIKGGHVVNWLQDIYPEVATTLGIGSEKNLAIRGMTALRNRSWCRAHTNVCIGEIMKERVQQVCGREVRVRVIPNWSDEEALAPLPVANNPLRREWNLPEESVIVGYSGNLGRAHDIDTMLDAGRRLVASGERQLQFLFVGGGVKQALLPSVAEEPNIGPHFQVRGYRPRGELRLSLAVADVHWLSLEPELEGLIVPSKFYGAIAAGRPIIFIGDTQGEIARMLNEAECGCSFAKGDVHGVAEHLRALSHDAALRVRLGENARKYCEDHLRKSKRLADWGALLEEVARDAARVPAGRQNLSTSRRSP